MILRLIYIILVSLFFVSLFLAQFSWAILIACFKAILVGYYFMELKHSHRIWKFGYLIFVFLTGTSLIIVSGLS